ncbi:uncharacterized protein J4E87_009014 [Alternaria ethzedia]|uniref:uncharacterized protein n=1 Tax=Alternaria triticimaculans TaxID=297637 RepID=UPI0020C56609|nr:uncharacterized protein J4E78_003126 [Alternaria triticimaculans]XP_049229658.1 uncharacterized protein J4E87_009014 [Alternaria ethzedia]XP_051328696.1 uncharacterized protein J4E85_003268 [Alternaria conjuncta]XP_051356556.1 uncharacterized protein J4E92_001918 [Alternaria infectoria]KAI4699996.1 hypothetical protein J4E81_004030 [Alternaria sp. BMP 2799]KAI4714998.1 hypothetical protein J4E89_000683 [Alternaria sp. Ai002NY15]KAI4615556.1 hypothetical protein J4E87_009014 [Alternaria eth
MAPNLFIATQKAFAPHKWFKSNKAEQSSKVVEEWTSPVPGQYESIPGRGWFLIATLKDDSKPEGHPSSYIKSSTGRVYVPLDRPVPLKYSHAIGRYFLEPEFNKRKKTVMIKNDKGKEVQAGFFRVDDVAWVKCWDEHDTFIPGNANGAAGYQRWVFDQQTQQFRHMIKRDDPNYVRSRKNSPARDADNRSQESVSTEYRTSRPGSTKNGFSVASTRANSFRYQPPTPTSNPTSQRPSRQSSPKRSDSIPLEEAKIALRRLAREHEEAAAALARSRMKRTDSKGRVEQIERGRVSERVGN